MFLCFEADGKRSAFPESVLLGVDENGFTVQNGGGNRPVTFFRMDAFQGACQNFQQALNWVRRKQGTQQGAQGQARPQAAQAANLPKQPKF
ncbi:hypothetical protein [Acanthopleuribacter pedis]|uniref:Uncharacterized protein n=1 Tax=Acanthopleuribacter pedis TaxID=442870 RepID=A0A8J7QFD2_9BACT|nr:hypothetical protein [Acanthopleuribacter pedis]MBO1323059.1 hypothetical protein [Acanthopleuribacter pedis]